VVYFRIHNPAFRDTVTYIWPIFYVITKLIIAEKFRLYYGYKIITKVKNI